MVKAKEKIENQYGKYTVPIEVIPGGKGSLKSRVRNEGSTLRTVHDGIAIDVAPSPSGSEEEDEEVNEAAERLRTRYAYRFIKRFFDIAFSLFVIIGFSWLFLIIAIAIKVDDPKGPIIFKQKRATRNGREFSMYKFRSMCANAEDRLSDLAEFNEKTGPVFKMHNDPRITRVGRLTRRLSLDELPQFANVLKGGPVGRGAPPRPALRGRDLHPAPAAAPARQERHHLLLADAQEPRLHHLRRVGRPRPALYQEVRRSHRLEAHRPDRGLRAYCAGELGDACD